MSRDAQLHGGAGKGGGRDEGPFLLSLPLRVKNKSQGEISTADLEQSSPTFPALRTSGRGRVSVHVVGEHVCVHETPFVETAGTHVLRSRQCSYVHCPCFLLTQMGMRAHGRLPLPRPCSKRFKAQEWAAARELRTSDLGVSAAKGPTRQCVYTQPACRSAFVSIRFSCRWETSLCPESITLLFRPLLPKPGQVVLDVQPQSSPKIP